MFIDVAFRHDLGLNSQWRRDGVAIPGATIPDSFPVFGATAVDAGVYDVEVSDPVNWWLSTESLPTVIEVHTSLGFWLQPQGGWRVRHGAIEFTAGPTGWPVEQWQWSKDGVTIPGATQPTLQMSNLQVSDAGSYTVTISNSCGSATSAPAQLQVTDLSGATFHLPPNFIGSVP